jgi:putative transposase
VSRKDGPRPSSLARPASVARRSIAARTGPARPPAGQRRSLDEIDRAILRRRAREPDRRQPNGRCAGRRDLRAPVNRKRVQRLMREPLLLQRKRSEGRRRRPGYFEATGPDELWHKDMTSIWVAEHGWVYLNAIIDCCTCEITGWAIDVRCRATEELAVVDAAVAERASGPGRLTLGSDNGTACTSRPFRARRPSWIVHRRGGYRDPESQAFIESWFSKPSCAGSGARSSRPSTRPAPRSSPTSTATTVGRTAA